MILSLFVTREAFAAQRRKAQDEGVEILVHDVPEAITAQQVTDDLLSSMELVYSGTYYDENKDGTPVMPRSVVPKVNDLLSHATPQSDVQATALAITNLLMNEATMQAAVDDEDDLFMEWVTMHDDAVRHAHVLTDGQVRPIGEKFDVDGVEMAFPGDIAAPIELWINCRCVLRPTYPPQFHVRETSEFISEKPWNGSASRFTPEQWKSSTILHVCDGMEKSCHKLPIKEPGGQLSRAGVHAAAARINQVDAPPDKVAAAKRALRGAYRQLGEDPPDAIKSAGEVVTMTQTFVPAEKRNPDEELEIDQHQPDPTLDDLTDEQLTALAGLVPWHGVLAPEGSRSGDGRMFAPDALTWRDLPLPLTYQKASASGHDGSVTIGSIENIKREDGLMLADGWLLSTPEADEVVSLMAHFGKYGVSVDADDAEFDYDEASESVTFSKARICSASVVSIPAFSEAYVALGPWSEDEALIAAGEFVNTEDGPGWLTHPVDTDRLRDYWVHGPGAAKIGWGTPGDFNRCRLNLAKYIKPEHLSGYCANRHYDALGFWPGRPTSGDVDQFEQVEGEQAPAINIVAAGAIKAPAAWFQNPNLTGPTHLTVTEEGRVFGHIAQWGVCHIGINKVCTTAPESRSGYAYYASGSVLLDNGAVVPTGVISMGGGHCDDGYASAVAAVAHYDSTSTAVADVCIGEDEHGIWCAGWMRPGTTEEQRYQLRASDVSGDWREVGGNLELVAVLAVNVNGFPVKGATRGGEMVTLVAAGMLHREEEEPREEVLAAAIVRAFEKVEQAKKRREAEMAALRAKYARSDDGM